MKCYKLSDVLQKPPFFDVSGGCGVDLSGGESSCMENTGVWFTYCPFCGRRILSEYVESEKGGHWQWEEDPEE